MHNLAKSFKAAPITPSPVHYGVDTSLERSETPRNPPKSPLKSGCAYCSGSPTVKHTKQGTKIRILAATPIDSGLLLADPTALPIRNINTINRQRVLIVAPHPDDETLGCGGAISLLCRQGYDVSVLIVSDGTGSHPNSQTYPAPRLRWTRSQETLTALEILGVKRWAITFLHLKDGAIPTVTAPKFHAAKLICRDHLQATLPDTIFLPWRRDPHPDHRATWQLIQAAILNLEITPQVIEYPIWDWDISQQITGDLSQITGWRLDIQSVLGQKTQAINSYRSQLGQLIDDDPDGFYLSAEMLANFTRLWEVYFEEVI